MNEVIVNSTQRLTREDVHAMAVYLKSLPHADPTTQSVGVEQIQAGKVIYKDRCEKCHLASGRGGLFGGPPLAGSAIVQADDPASLINVVLYGQDAPASISLGSWETMKAYGEVLSDAQVAAVCNYVRGSWGNNAPTVHERDVAQQR
jgi:mono/diheme cytochrome c family protein